MLENEFEKNVQQRMDEFRLRPSDDIWRKVAGELNRKKKRRTVFFIFLLAGLGLLGYTGIYFLNHSKQNIVEQNSTFKTTTPSHPEKTLITPVAPGAKEKTNGEAYDGQPSANSHTVQSTAEEGNSQVSLRVERETATRDKASNEPAAQRSTVQPKKKVATDIAKSSLEQPVKTSRLKAQRHAEPKPSEVNDRKAIDDKEDTDHSNNLAGINEREQETREKQQPVTPINEVAPVTAKKDIDENKADSNAVIASAITAAVDSTTGEIAKAAQQDRSSSKIKWGVDFSIGKSDGRKSALPFSDGNKAMDRYYNVSGPNFPGGAGYFPIQPPSPVESGLAFKVGPMAQMQLSKRSRFSFGLQYAFMSSRIKTGTYTATNVVVNNSNSQALRLSAVYQGTYQRAFTNRFHFIDAPLTYHLQLNKGRKLPIDWNVGIAPGYLVATNALLYDSAAGGIYYHDRNAYNRFQLNLHTGFAFRFGNRSKIQWSVGPELSMAMNKLVNDPYSKKQYMMYGGVTGRLIFSKKNK